jgi:CheY-like chemotaxis protein
MSNLAKKTLILYADDDDLVSHLVQKYVTDFEILRVNSGEEALEFLNRSGAYHDAPRPDLLLLDLHMPRRDGFEILASIRASTALATLPVAIFTTSQWPADRAKAFALGATHFVLKPTGLDAFAELATTLGEIVREIHRSNGNLS